ncbi:hypothetical protein ARMGADRAFT_944824, partial [Armillaria gallica]
PLPPPLVNTSAINHIQHVIKKIVTPSWINSVPANYGESSAGTIKADEWHTLSTIYLPIAFVTLWGDTKQEDSEALKILDHTMALFQAVTIVCHYTMTPTRAEKYCHLMREWVDGLHVLHPHTQKHKPRTNIHASFHIYDFLILFGPVISWWCFPFECLIGSLQKFKTNNHIGGKFLHK